MDSIMTELVLWIGMMDIETYRGMIAIPKFARAVTCGYRLNAMEKFGFTVKYIPYIHTFAVARNHFPIKFSRSNEFVLHGHGGINIGFYIAYGARNILNQCIDLVLHQDEGLKNVRGIAISYHNGSRSWCNWTKLPRFIDDTGQFVFFMSLIFYQHWSSILS